MSYRIQLSFAWLALLCSNSIAADDGPIKSDEDALKAAGIATDGPALVEFFRSRILVETDRGRVLAIVRNLGDDAFEVREKATDELASMGPRAVAILREATHDPDIEIVRRAEYCLRQIDKIAGPSITKSVARLMAHGKPAGSAEALLAFLPFADDDLVLDEVRSTLAAVAVRDGNPEKAVIDAVQDPLPLRRSVAAEALVRSGRPELLQAMHRMLADPEKSVRLRVALALLDGKDKTAVPVLIGLLGDLSREECWPVEDVLFRLAGDLAPKDVPQGTDEAARKKCRDAWKDWWAHNGEKIDLAKLDLTERLQGYTLLVEMDMRGVNGKVIEIGPDKKTRWQIENLQQPMDAQVLKNDRVLIAEYRARKVTERNFKGEVLWEKSLTNNPLGAQRLINGNTFIVCRNQILEVDRAGKEVFNYPRAAMDIMSAQKLRNGQIGLVTQAGMFVRLDATGKKELKSFAVGQQQMFGGNFEVLANSHVLVPLYGNNRVIEFDQDGKLVWEANANLPTCLSRLPNGNTLVGSMYNQQVTELDRNGKQVWDHHTEGRIYRVRRR